MTQTHIRPIMEAFAQLEKQHVDDTAGLTTPCIRCRRQAAWKLWGQFFTPDGLEIQARSIPCCNQHHTQLYQQWQQGKLHELDGREIVTLNPARLPL